MNGDDLQASFDDDFRKKRRQLFEKTIEKISDDNARLRKERSARRYKYERDPIEYEQQKNRKRQRYADARNGEVRPYEKIEARTKEEHAEKAKARHAEKERARSADLSLDEKQARSDRADKNRFFRERRKSGMLEHLIEAAYAERVRLRDEKRASTKVEAKQETTMQQDPLFGMF